MATTTPNMPAAGQRHSGLLKSDLPVLRDWEWPFVSISGQQDGPLATVIAGVHGAEYVSIHAAQRLARELDPADVRGRILIVPIVNLPMFWERSAFTSPIDGLNLNRVFPGNPEGTFTEALAHLIFSTCIAPSDTFIDLHGGDVFEELASFSGYAADAAPEVTARSRALAEALGLEFCLGSVDAPGTVSGQSNRVAARHGIVSALAEAGGNGLLTMPEVDLLVDGTRRALQVAGHLAGEPQAPPRPSRMMAWSGSVYASQDGFWVADVRAGQELRAGQQLGRLLDLLGQPLETLTAANDGVVVYRTTSAAVKQGGLLAAIAAESTP
jgi:predicted deacylase